jgi:hypothetical protein
VPVLQVIRARNFERFHAALGIFLWNFEQNAEHFLLLPKSVLSGLVACFPIPAMLPGDIVRA